jgi:FkbM family methyltransferase
LNFPIKPDDTGSKALKQPKIFVKSLDHVLFQYADMKNDVFFIQIGSNDGRSGDPLHDLVFGNRWRGILVEPVPYLFERLKIIYQSQSQLIFENCVIANTSGELDFYWLRPNNDGLPDWYEQLGSLRLDVILSHREKIPDIDQYVVKEKVRAMTFEQLLAKHDVVNVDLVHIDTEGYDYEIIKTIDFSKTRPDIILYEHQHLNQIDAFQCRQQMQEAGYVAITQIGSYDTLCIQKLIWKQLGPGKN